MNALIVELSIATDAGRFVARYSEQGLVSLHFPGPGIPRYDRAAPRAVPAQVHRWHQLTEAALQRVLTGREPGALPPLDWTGKTEFQQAVWRAMMRIAPGKTKSYGEIAGAIGRPKAVRAVGGACGANPIPVLVPCHRVLAAHGKIGGFSSGLDWKRTLLAREGVKI